MKIRIEFYGVLQEVMDTREMELDGPVEDVQSVVHALAASTPALKDHLPRLAYAVDDELAETTTQLKDGSTLALLPPVSGG